MLRRLGRGAMALWLLALACKGTDSELPPAYRNIEVPKERLASAAARARGRELFRENCAICHGVNGDGRGERKEGFSTPPQDFTDPAWRRRATPRTVFHSIREGEHGTAMPSWKPLGDEAIWDLTAYVLSLGSER
jgi:mono/diheme cytochrome c family protein